VARALWDSEVAQVVTRWSTVGVSSLARALWDSEMAQVVTIWSTVGVSSLARVHFGCGKQWNSGLVQ